MERYVLLWCGAVPAWWVQCGVGVVGVVPVQPVFSLVRLVTIKVGSCTSRWTDFFSLSVW